MLILSQTPNESITITTKYGETIKITTTEIRNRSVRLGFECSSRSITVMRDSVTEKGKVRDGKDE